MANTSNARENPEGRNRENDVINQAEFRAFQQETQQALLAIQATLAGLTTGNNQRCDVEEGPEGRRGRNNPNREHLPIPRRHLAYEEELSDDEEYTIYSLTEAINLAIKAETQLGRTRIATFLVNSYEQSNGGPSKGKAPMNPPTPSYTPRGTSHNRLPTNTAGAAVTEAPRNPYSRPSSDKCYR
ncbi:hypothetical protein DKX38_015545 [Salix brachista]|uniref:Uncharacterized protein n=1 Tax=Salix brachista TaxID=2182728 RepID=A0A5N5L5P5_9ROSI|nr:hypothetical protein DKX38_015545 [Salix brachista]